MIKDDTFKVGADTAKAFDIETHDIAAFLATADKYRERKRDAIGRFNASVDRAKQSAIKEIQEAQEKAMVALRAISA